MSFADIPMPARIARLPRDRHGHPIPWFVHMLEDGTPEFRVVRKAGLPDALLYDLCWICGQRRGRWGTFVIGPMCAVNRISAEPPSHRDCAEYAARACPFLATPSMRRRTTGLPEDMHDPAGVMVLRNPGVAVTWTSRTWKAFNPGPPSPGILFKVGDPGEDPGWYAHGRPATRAECWASIEAGLPALMAAAEVDGPSAVAALKGDLAAAALLLPAGPPATVPLAAIIPTAPQGVPT